MVAVPIYVGTLGSIMAEITEPYFRRVEEQMVRMSALRALRLPVDSTAAYAEAGTLLRVILEDLDRASWTYERPADSTFEGSPLFRVRRGGESGWRYSVNERNAIALALGGLLPEERAFLAGFAEDPRFTAFERLAELHTIDPGWRGIQTETVFSWWYSRPDYSPLREVAVSKVAQAALAITDADYQTAERVLREVLSVGLIVFDQSGDVDGSLQGSAISGMGARGLELVYSETGRHNLASQIRGVNDGQEQETGGAPDRGDPSSGNTEEVHYSVLSDPAALRSTRWESLRFLSFSQSCGGLQKVLYGPSSEFDESAAIGQRDLVRFPSEEARFRGSIEGIERLARMSWAEVRSETGASDQFINGFSVWVGDWAAGLSGNPRLSGCMKAYLAAF